MGNNPIRVYADTSVYGGVFNALATVAECRLIVSWNFKHIVSFRKIPLYNGVNLTKGYGVIGFHTPQEVVPHEDEDV